eukprot:3466336-Lingulodinium_polyedra.AAC.1
MRAEACRAHSSLSIRTHCGRADADKDMWRPAAWTVVVESHPETRKALQAIFGYKDVGRLNVRTVPDGVRYVTARAVCDLIRHEGRGIRRICEARDRYGIVEGAIPVI